MQQSDKWDFWGDEAKLSCVGYSGQIDQDALNVLKGIAAKKYNTDIAAELGLPGQYIELLQAIFCSVGWASYGTSPRCCWIAHEHDGAELVAKFEAFVRAQWLDPE